MAAFYATRNQAQLTKKEVFPFLVKQCLQHSSLRCARSARPPPRQRDALTKRKVFTENKLGKCAGILWNPRVQVTWRARTKHDSLPRRPPSKPFRPGPSGPRNKRRKVTMALSLQQQLTAWLPPPRRPERRRSRDRSRLIHLLRVF